MGTGPQQARWPAHLPAGALRVVRWSARYEETVAFYRDTIGLPVLETFHDSYGLDGTILGLPAGQVHLEIVRAGRASYPWPASRAPPARTPNPTCAATCPGARSAAW